MRWQIFEDSRGIQIAFGYDMIERVKDPRVICTSNIGGGWTIDKHGMATRFSLLREISPEFVFEIPGNRVCAYQPGLCVEMTFIGQPFIWGVKFLAPEGNVT